MPEQSHCVTRSITVGHTFLQFSTLLGHLLDTIKVNQQINPHLLRASPFVIAKLLVEGDSLQLFRGIGSPMANQIIMTSVVFTAFNKVKNAANKSTLLNENSSGAAAGLSSGFATACLSIPTGCFKIQAQMSLSRSNNGKQPSISIWRDNIMKNGKN